MGEFFNLDLFSVGLTIAGIAILSVVVYFNDRGSVTARTLLGFSTITILWSIANYARYHVGDPTTGLWFVRAITFLGSWHALLSFQLCYAFPNREVRFPKLYTRALIPIVAGVSLITLTPFVFEKVSGTTSAGVVSEITNGPGIALFLILIVSLIGSGIVLLARKAFRSTGIDRRRILIVSAGTLATFACIVVFNIILPAVFDNARFLPLSALFIFPFIAATSYSLIRYRLLDIKVAATEITAFFLSITALIQVVFSESSLEMIFHLSVFALTLSFSILLVQGVVREIQQREQIEHLAKSLEQANARLRELDKLKSEFVSIASHQLRSPLTAVKGYASLLLEGSFGAVGASAREALQRIFESANLMALSVEDFLNVSRIEQGRMKYEMAEFDMRKVVEVAVDEMLPIVSKKGLALSYAPGAEPFMVKADLGKMKQVIANLIDNAVKYTPTGSIAVSIGNAGNAVRVSVRDTGVGIPAGSIGKLFDRFVRAENANTVNVMGTGLGLYVAKQMVEAHRGKIWAESEGEGKGSTFIVEVPALRSPAPAFESGAPSGSIRG